MARKPMKVAMSATAFSVSMAVVYQDQLAAIASYMSGLEVLKRKAFKELLAANKRLRRKRPALRLVVSNPPRTTITEAEAA